MTSVSSLIILLFYRVNESVALKLLNKAGEMPSLETPEDKSIRTLYVDGWMHEPLSRSLEITVLSPKVKSSREDSTSMGLCLCGLRDRPEKEQKEQPKELSNKLVIKGLGLKLMGLMLSTKA